MDSLKNLSGDVQLINNVPVFTGPYSTVYRGYLKSTGQLVAIKKMNGIRGASMKTIQRKVRREGLAWSSFEHRNILPFYGCVPGDGDDDRFQPYGAFISPWYRRGDLEQYLRENPSTHMEDRLKIWQGVADGVAYLHGYVPVVVHGDLKPGNILVDDHSTAKICDFGLARVITEEGHCGLTTTTAHTGTARYLAYELVRTEFECADPTTCSDIYATGCIGLEAVFREVPYTHRKTGNRLLSNIEKDMEKGIPPAIRPIRLSDEEGLLWDLIAWCWAVNPAERPQARQLSAELENISRLETDFGPTTLPSTAIQQAEIQTHPPKRDIGPTTFKIGVDANLSSRQSGPNDSRNNMTNGIGDMEHLFPPSSSHNPGVHEDHSLFPVSPQPTEAMYNGSNTHLMHQETLQDSIGLGHSADITMESDVNPHTQAGAAGDTPEDGSLSDASVRAVYNPPSDVSTEDGSLSDMSVRAVYNPPSGVSVRAVYGGRGRSVRWTEGLVAPTPEPGMPRPKGWFNRRGDQLWHNDGRYKPAVQEYPRHLRGYPDVGEGWMNERGERISMTHRRMPEQSTRPPKGVLKFPFASLGF